MLEQELKLHVPVAARQQIREQLLGLGAKEQRLRARYFDTPDRRLARAGVALRLRLEGEHWIQTAKAPGPDELSRIELNHPRPHPELDLTVYQGTAIEKALKGLSHSLGLRYETDVLRLKLVHQVDDPVHPGTLELAFDVGQIRAGDLTLDLCELEFELLSGTAGTIFHEGRAWMQAHGLVLDLRSKAERGDLLAQHMDEAQNWNDQTTLRNALRIHGHTEPGNGLRIDPYAQSLLRPQRAGAITLSQDMTLQQAYQACLADCVNHVVRNSTLLAGVDNAGAGPSQQRHYVHQLRVGMRRLRTCWKFFGRWVDTPLSDTDLRRYFRLLGSASDNDVLRFEIAPRLARAGMPALPPPAARKTASADNHHPSGLAASTPFQLYLLDLLEHLVNSASLGQAAAARVAARATGHGAHHRRPARLETRLETRLQKWLHQLCREGRDFSQLSRSAQHDLRKKLKRLRYSLEFSKSVLTGNKLSGIRSLLPPIQHTMGELNDMYNAWQYYETLSRSESAALFALGWLKAMQDQLERQIQNDLDRLGAASRH